MTLDVGSRVYCFWFWNCDDMNIYMITKQESKWSHCKLAQEKALCVVLILLMLWYNHEVCYYVEIMSCVLELCCYSLRHDVLVVLHVHLCDPCPIDSWGCKNGATHGMRWLGMLGGVYTHDLNWIKVGKKWSFISAKTSFHAMLNLGALRATPTTSWGC